MLQGFSFEIKGSVQGVFFRKYTQREATRLGLSGWVANTNRNTVVGQVWLRNETPDTGGKEMNPKLAEMKQWLTCVGSPHSRIEHASFQTLPLDERPESYSSGCGFQIRPNYP
jgi:acylphosphatase